MWFYVLFKISEKLLTIAIFDMQGVGEEERLVHFNFIPLRTFWIFKPHLCVISLSKIR